jgi:arylsulfatase
MIFVPEGRGGVMIISINGTEVARGNIARRALAMAGLGETFDTGRDTNVAVTDDYADGGEFTGTIDKIVVNVRLPSTSG